MPDLPQNLAASARADNPDAFQYNVEQVLYDITDNYNARCDSQRQTLIASPQAGAIPDLPIYGSGILLINGTKNGQPAGIFIMCKADSGQSGTVGELMQVKGTDGFLGASVTITWPANSAPQISASTPMLINALWRN